MNVSDFDYHLPEERIAQTPTKRREDSRLLVMERITGERIHSYFHRISKFLRPADVLVLNNSRVRPARLQGRKETGAKIELLILKPLGEDIWEALVKPSKRIKPGTVVKLGEGRATAVALKKSDVDGGWMFQFHDPQGKVEQLFDEVGTMPLPPYIHQRLEDPERYQTVYAKKLGSAAAPTAGLHFTEELLSTIKNKGIEIAYLTLHVGLGTFRPVQTDRIEDHRMHAEYFELTQSEAEKIYQAKKNGGRVVAVGTTSARTLETIAQQHKGEIVAAKGWSDLFIYPGFSFQVIDGLLTNFHLPKSTLLMLVSAFSSREHILAAYQEAIEKRYRFFSFGDAMLII